LSETKVKHIFVERKKTKMKKLLLLTSVAALTVLAVGCKKDKVEDTKTTEEFLASTTPENRKVVLEDFTGVRCGFCPDGHVKAKALQDANPGKVFVIAVHAGSYAAPLQGWANFTTPFGEAIDRQALPMGYPAGTINRIVYTDLLQTTTQNNMTYSSKIAMSRGAWATGASRAMALSAPVNIGAKATFDAATRELTVKVDMYYTADQSADENNLNVALVQDKLISNQSGGSANYEQNHVLRHLLTGQWGEAITDTKTIGSKVTKTYKYTVPADYNGTSLTGGGAVVVENLKVVAFVAKGKVDILNATEVDVK
jgi:hypothetical protein